MTQKKNKKIISENHPKEAQEYLQEYLKEVAELPVLTEEEEEKELAKKIEEGDIEAKKKLGRANLKLVIKIAQYYALKTKKLTMLDLIYDGNLGLFKAVEIYDWRSNYKFSTFATLLIRRAILRAIEDAEKNLINMTLETPLYQNKKGKWVTWEELTREEKIEEKKKSRKICLNPTEIKENLEEIIDLLSKSTNISKGEAKQEIQKVLRDLTE